MDGLIISKRLLMSGFAWQRWMAIRRNHTIDKKAKNHYEVLGLNQDCTQEEVKAKYIKLSQEHHPDKNPTNPDHHNDFVEINEAYSVLHKAYNRSVYDSHLKELERGPRGGFTHEYGGIKTNAPREKVIFYDDSIWETRDHSKDSQYAHKPYYGVPGIKKKLSNTFIAAGAIVFMIVGGVIHFVIAKISSDKTIAYMNERDMEAGQNYSMARNRAQLGNEEAMDRLRKKVEHEKLMFEAERNKKSTENDSLNLGAETDNLQRVRAKTSFQVQATTFSHQRKTEPEFYHPRN